MCLVSTSKLPAPQKIAAFDNAEAQKQSDIEDKLRRQAGGAAANIMTSPMGIPSSATMGGAA